MWYRFLIFVGRWAPKSLENHCSHFPIISLYTDGPKRASNHQNEKNDKNVDSAAQAKQKNKKTIPIAGFLASEYRWVDTPFDYVMIFDLQEHIYNKVKKPNYMSAGCKAFRGLEYRYVPGGQKTNILLDVTPNKLYCVWVSFLLEN